VLGIAMIEVPFETSKLVPVFLHRGKTHFGDEYWPEKYGELLILPPGVSDKDRADALKSKWRAGRSAEYES
jgi:hypothetical protein